MEKAFRILLFSTMLIVSCNKPSVTPPNTGGNGNVDNPKITLSISPSQINFDANAGSDIINITTNAPQIIIQASNADWISSELNNTSLKISVSQNPSYEMRKATLTLVAADQKGHSLNVSSTLTISQAAKEKEPTPSSVTLSNSTISSDYLGVSIWYDDSHYYGYIDVTSDAKELKAESSQPWCKALLNQIREGEYTFGVSVDAWDGKDEARQAQINFYDGNNRTSLASIAITQEPIPWCYLVEGADSSDDSKVISGPIYVKADCSQIYSIVTNCSSFNFVSWGSWNRIERINDTQIKISTSTNYSSSLRDSENFFIDVNNKSFTFIVKEKEDTPDYGSGDDGYEYGPEIELD